MCIHDFEVPLSVGLFDEFGVASGIGAEDIEDEGDFLSAAGVVAGFVWELVLELGASEFGVLHVAGVKDEFLHSLLVGLLCDGFDDASEQAVADVAVGVFGAGFEVEWLGELVADDIGGLQWAFEIEGGGDGHEFEHGIARAFAVEAGGVLEEVADANRGPAWIDVAGGGEIPVFGVLIEPVEKSVVEGELAAAGEAEDGGGGEGFGDAGDPHDCIWLHRELCVEIGIAEATFEDEAIAIEYCEGGAGDLFFAKEFGDEEIEGFEVFAEGAGDWDFASGDLELGGGLLLLHPNSKPAPFGTGVEALLDDELIAFAFVGRGLSFEVSGGEVDVDHPGGLAGVFDRFDIEDLGAALEACFELADDESGG